jgi:uncharacterized protein
MATRIIGFDLARAYAIFGMFIVNFNTVFGSHSDQSLTGRFLVLFDGNSSSLFVILSGMGMALMTGRSVYTDEERSQIKRKILKRALFLIVAGFLLSLWWPADILHFYGIYMSVAALLIFLSKRIYLWAAASSVLIFHLFLLLIPYETGWNFETLVYTGFWTFKGFMLNIFYNGWNSVFPWIAYFFLGMWLGRMNWADLKIRKNLFLVGLAIFSATEMVQYFAANSSHMDQSLRLYITADYIPPFLPFMLSTSGSALMMLSFFIYLGDLINQEHQITHRKIAKLFSATGQMTLTHYISHLTIGLFLFSLLTEERYGIQLELSPLNILLFSFFYFISSCVFSVYWLINHKSGPIEILMRKFSG